MMLDLIAQPYFTKTELNWRNWLCILFIRSSNLQSSTDLGKIFLTEQTAREPIFGGFSPLNFRKRWCLHLVDKVLYDGFLQRKTKCKNRSKKIRITFMLKTLSVIPKWFSSSCRFSPLLSSTLTHKVLRGAKRKWILNEIKNFIPHLKTKLDEMSFLPTEYHFQNSFKRKKTYFS